VKSFLQQEASQFPALEIQYVPGHKPELHLLNSHEVAVEVVDLAPFDSEGIINVLARFGISRSTPQPSYTLPEIEATEHCVAWRQTGNCDPENGPRESKKDLSCSETILHGLSGFCECKDSSKNVRVTCDHEQFVCEDLCSGKSTLAEPEVAAPQELPPSNSDEF